MHRYNQLYRLKTQSGSYRWFFDQTQRITDRAEEIIRADNRKIRYIKALGKVEFDKDTGRSVRMVGSAQDITERKQAEEALELAKLQVERANEPKSRYLFHMNHEIRIPLNGFMGFLQLMEDTQLDQQQQEFIHHMKQSTSHLQSIINNVLDYAKIEAGQRQLDNRKFNLEEEIGTALAPLRSLALHKSIHLEVTLGKILPRQVEGDPDRLRQIILNLGEMLLISPRKDRSILPLNAGKPHRITTSSSWWCQTLAWA